MKRRDFVTALGGAAAAWPLRALAQTAAKVYRVGLLNPGGLDVGPFEAPLVRGLAKHGYALDRNLVLERRGAGGHAARLPQLVAELAASKVAVIIVLGYLPALAAKQGTTLPVVVFSAGIRLQPGSPTAWRGPAGTSPASRTSRRKLRPSGWSF